MREPDRSPEGVYGEVLEALRRSYQEVQREHGALVDLGGLVQRFAEENRRLHARHRAGLEALRQDVEGLKQQIKRLSAARA
jgi:hypothetical protein